MSEKWKMLFDMFCSFLKIGTFTIGGGYAMLPLIEQEFVGRKGWVSKEEIVNILAVSQSMPGVIAINASLFVGYKVGKVKGACVAAAGMILPSFFIILMIAVFFNQYRSVSVVQNAFSGVRAGITALILFTAIRLARSVINCRSDLLIAVFSFLLIALFEIHPIVVLLFSALTGLALFWKGKK
ncbi:MAG: chromate transporter [Fibrobacter sp.]|jgi:chromate transporter|nr:chromate transporter [Fibrobacter sp.]